jgi:hypothetical protein
MQAPPQHQEFLGFLNHIDANVPPDLDIHLVNVFLKYDMS